MPSRTTELSALSADSHDGRTSLAKYLYLVTAGGKSLERQCDQVLVTGGSPKTDVPRRLVYERYGTTRTKVFASPPHRHQFKLGALVAVATGVDGDQGEGNRSTRPAIAAVTGAPGRLGRPARLRFADGTATSIGGHAHRSRRRGVVRLDES
jgi:hypothetical protein